MTKRKVLIPLDQSVYSRKILVPIRQFIPPAETELILLHVADQITVDSKDTIPDPIYADQVAVSISNQIKLKLQPEVDMLQQASYMVSMIVTFGDPADEVLRAIKAQQIDLIAMTTHAREGLKRLLFGSVAEKVLHQVNIPILLLHPEERSKAEAAELVRGKTTPRTGTLPA